MLTDIDVETHERVVSVKDDAAGLNAIIAIHSTALGPAGGGCRLWTYGSDELALQDALKLSQGMSYKNAMAGIPLGGGKAVIRGPISACQRKQVFAAFGRAVDALGGAYITAEDVGVRVADMLEVASQTAYVSGLSASNGIGGDPSPFTARGVFCGIKAAVEHQFGTSDLAGLRVA
ncbi:MAG: Glu/Leu/Phe/Val dehydrogenase dimerization domain-containing protein, partial [Pseudomonadota bacterium]